VGVPDVNESFAEYAPSLIKDRTILFGMAAVRNVGEALVEKIVSEREVGGPYQSIYDFVRRVDPMVLNRRSMESLIKAGAFDSLGVPRLGLPATRRRNHRRHAQSPQGPLLRHLHALRRPGRRRRCRRLEGTEIALGDLEFDKSVKLDFEREMLGTYISDHPLYEIESLLAARTDGSIISIRERGEDLAKANKVVTVGGILAEVQLRTTKAGQQYAAGGARGPGRIDGD